jgi:hypothetical protein
MFTEKFDSYVCDNDTISTNYQGFEIIATIIRDPDYHIDDDDVHNTDQSVTGCNDEQQEKLIEAREAWFNGEWFYCGVVLSAYKNGVLVDDHIASLWGIECNYPGSDNSCLLEMSNELLQEGIDQAKESLSMMLDKLKRVTQ